MTLYKLCTIYTQIFYASSLATNCFLRWLEVYHIPSIFIYSKLVLHIQILLLTASYNLSGERGRGGVVGGLCWKYVHNKNCYIYSSLKDIHTGHTSSDIWPHRKSITVLYTYTLRIFKCVDVAVALILEWTNREE